MADNKKYYKNKQNPNSFLVLEPRENISEIDALNWDEITKTEYNIRLQIRDLKIEIAQTDYIASKLAECDTTEERTAIKTTYATQLARRVEIRALINNLEEEL